MSDTHISRGYTGRRRERGDPARIPPGQYLTRDFPVEIVVTRRGKRVARLSAIGRDEALAELVRRGLVRLPERPRSRRRASVAARGSVSELVAEQRR